jgi:putative peptide maturation dehydrogenase
VRVKRASFVLFDLADGQRVDLAALLRGEIDVTPQAPDVYALALLTGRRERMTHAEFGALLTASAGGFVEAAEIGTEAGLARSLAERGLLISDSDDEPFAAFRAREADLVEHGWNLYAAGYHFMTKREGMDLRDDPAYRPGERVAGPELKQAFVEAFGASPPPFHSPAPQAPRVTLPRIARDDGLYAALAARRTTRSFALDETLRRDDLATVLQYVFGAHGTAETDLGVVIRRTSPAGGARHSIEAYALIAQVEGVDPGLYHYSVRDHELALLSPMPGDAVRELATVFTCGQDYFGNAHVSFVLTARFDRCYWKYRETDKAYAAILAEAGHLSQTQYLVAAELGLGSYVTLAVNAKDIERRLGIDGADEGVVAMTGCGPRTPGFSPLELEFTPLP